MQQMTDSGEDLPGNGQLTGNVWAVDYFTAEPEEYLRLNELLALKQNVLRCSKQRTSDTLMDRFWLSEPSY